MWQRCIPLRDAHWSWQPATALGPAATALDTVWWRLDVEACQSNDRNGIAKDEQWRSVVSRSPDLDPSHCHAAFPLVAWDQSLETLIWGGSLKVVLPLPIWGSKGQDLTDTLSHWSSLSWCFGLKGFQILNTRKRQLQKDSLGAGETHNPNSFDNVCTSQTTFPFEQRWPLHVPVENERLTVGGLLFSQ